MTRISVRLLVQRVGTNLVIVDEVEGVEIKVPIDRAGDMARVIEYLAAPPLTLSDLTGDEEPPLDTPTIATTIITLQAQIENLQDQVEQYRAALLNTLPPDLTGMDQATRHAWIIAALAMKGDA